MWTLHSRSVNGWKPADSSPVTFRIRAPLGRSGEFQEPASSFVLTMRLTDQAHGDRVRPDDLGQDQFD
jgi:hypothetical protein